MKIKEAERGTSTGEDQKPRRAKCFEESKRGHDRCHRGCAQGTDQSGTAREGRPRSSGPRYVV